MEGEYDYEDEEWVFDYANCTDYIEDGYTEEYVPDPPVPYISSSAGSTAERTNKGHLGSCIFKATYLHPK